MCHMLDGNLYHGIESDHAVYRDDIYLCGDQARFLCTGFYFIRADDRTRTKHGLLPCDNFLLQQRPF